MQVTRVSQISGEAHTVEIPRLHKEELAVWEAMPAVRRPYIQEFFSYLTASEREFLMTGITQEEWDEMMPPEED